MKRNRKKYRIRKFSPIWWAGGIGTGLLTIVGSYAWVLLLASCPV